MSTAAPNGVTQESGRGRGPQSGPGSFLILYETVILALAAALTIGLAAGGDERITRSLPFLFTVLILWGVFDLLGTLVLQKGERNQAIRLIGDLTFCLCLVGWTGGIDSFLLPILLACMALASSELGSRRALGLATGASLVLLSLTGAQMNGLVAEQLTGDTVRDLGWPAAVRLMGVVIAIYAVALLGSRLGGGLRHVERINDLIVSAIGEGVVIVDPNGRVRHVNQIARRILGFPEDYDWHGRQVHEVLRRSVDGPLRQELQSPQVGVRKVEYEVERERRLPLLLRTAVAQAGQAGEKSWVFLMRDLTLEERVSRAEARVEHLEELEDLALGLAHEIRNPLASIRGGVQELSSGRLSGEQSDRLARVILKESDRLDRTVSQFMEYSRTKAQEESAPVSIPECLRDICEVLEQRADMRDREIRLVPSDAELISIEGNRDLLHKLFLNLSINAIEAEATKIELRCEPGRSGGVQVSVTDNGSGMDEETKARAFNPFFTTKTREGGLGLALVRKIVDGHRGTIEVQSERDRGTQIYVWFPAERSSSLPLERESQGVLS